MPYWMHVPKAMAEEYAEHTKREASRADELVTLHIREGRAVCARILDGPCGRATRAFQRG